MPAENWQIGNPKKKSRPPKKVDATLGVFDDAKQCQPKRKCSAASDQKRASSLPTRPSNVMLSPNPT